MSYLALNYRNILNRIKQDNPAVELIAVSKTFPVASIRELYSLGQRDFAENYVQELCVKVQELNDLDIIWHFIGSIQSNKTKLIAQNAHWVHGLVLAKHAIRLNNDRVPSMGRLNVLIEINISQETARHGLLNITQILDLAQIITTLPNLNLRGLMGIASVTDNQHLIEAQFQHLHQLFDKLQQNYPQVDSISMGMSNDFELAIKHGATILRIGSLIFGQRKYNNT